MTTENQLNNTYESVDSEIHDSSWVEHSAEGPHIPLIQGETVYGPITNITLTIILFAAMVSLFAFFAKRALKSDKKSKLKTGVLTYVQFADRYLRDTFGEKSQARKVFPLIVGMFTIIFFWNLLGLIIDWLGMSVSGTIFYYLRPMHSDLNTTLVLATVVVVTMLTIQVKSQWGASTVKSYAFNFHGNNFIDKCINVFVGWLHFIGLYSTLASLSLRLFGNIFAWIVLIAVISFLGALASWALFEIGRLLAAPFWFFEVFVALIQAIVFSALMIAYFKQSGEAH